MQVARQSLIFLPLPPRALRLLPLPAAAPLLLPARLPPRATSDLDQASRLLVSRLRLTNDLLKALKKLLANLPSPSDRYVRRPRFSGAGFPDLRALLERLARRSDTITLAAILAAALLLYVLRRWAAEGAAEDDDDEEEADGITTSGGLPVSTRRQLTLLVLPLVPRGPARAWSAPRSTFAFGGHLAGAVPLSHVLRVRGVPQQYMAAEGAADDDEDEEADGITSSGRLPASTRRRLLIMALQLLPRGPGAGARRAPRAWTVRHSFDSHAAAAAALQQERLTFPARKMTGQQQTA